MEDSDLYSLMEFHLQKKIHKKIDSETVPWGNYEKYSISKRVKKNLKSIIYKHLALLLLKVTKYLLYHGLTSYMNKQA